MWFLPWREVVVAVQREGVCVPCAHASRARARSHRDIVQRDHDERDFLALTCTLYLNLYLLVNLESRLCPWVSGSGPLPVIDAPTYGLLKSSTTTCLSALSASLFASYLCLVVRGPQVADMECANGERKTGWRSRYAYMTR